ncbi:uncharacterized protein LOC105919489 isoform X4 [Fundulus heteroclitus]|uniref:uncharacterized protein LOC105919489 isoform X4 n=1 Tax=Fundulus heteroclitus TaxID=8078 RepID=UPI00165ADCB7|nr:uncharacterized protein LOC105919489 isoform X4 [Fundulus heteroclitus]
MSGEKRVRTFTDEDTLRFIHTRTRLDFLFTGKRNKAGYPGDRDGRYHHPHTGCQKMGQPQIQVQGVEEFPDGVICRGGGRSIVALV